MQSLTNLKTKLSLIPKIRLYAYGVAILLGVGYLLWSIYGEKAVKPGTVIHNSTSPKIEKLEKHDVPMKKSNVFVDKKKAVAKLGLPAEEADDDSEELADGVETPPTKYGSTTAVFVNRSTGVMRTATVVKPSPWFRLERENEIGIEGNISNRGKEIAVDYQRSIFSIKGFVVNGKVGIDYFPDASKDNSDWHVGVRVKRNF